DGGNYSIDVYASTGSSFALQRWVTKAGGYASSGQWVAGDFNGDGKADMGMAFSDGGDYSIDAYASTGSSFALQRWITKAGGYVSSGQWASGDFNGDGKDDMAVTFNESGSISVDAYMSGGSSFGVSRWTTKQGAYNSSSKWLAGDFDNDGK